MTDDISKSSSTCNTGSSSNAGPMFVQTVSAAAASLQAPASTTPLAPPQTTSSMHPDDSTELTHLTESIATNSNAFQTTNTTAPPPQRSSSFKRFRRSSSKKKKSETASGADDEEQIILNNGRENAHLLSANNATGSGAARLDPFLRTGTPRIQNNTKDTNRLSPQNSIRRVSTSLSVGSAGGGPGSRRASACIYNNSQFYQNLNRPQKNSAAAGTGQPGQRRMSSIELAFGKASNLNLYNLEANRKSMSYTNSKIDLDKWKKSMSELNEPDMLQQYVQERDKRKNSVSQQHSRRERNSLQPQQVKEQQLSTISSSSKIKILIERLKPTNFTEERESYSMYIFPEDNR